MRLIKSYIGAALIGVVTSLMGFDWLTSNAEICYKGLLILTGCIFLWILVWTEIAKIEKRLEEE